jgi:hypothetical protein
MKFEIITSKPNSEKNNLTKGSYLLIQPVNLQKNANLTLTETQKTSSDPTSLIKKGDVLINTVGNMESMANMYKWDLDIKAVVGNGVYIIRGISNSQYDSLYNHYYHLKTLAGGKIIKRITRQALEAFVGKL